MKAGQIWRYLSGLTVLVLRDQQATCTDSYLRSRHIFVDEVVGLILAGDFYYSEVGEVCWFDVRKNQDGWERIA